MYSFHLSKLDLLGDVVSTAVAVYGGVRIGNLEPYKSPNLVKIESIWIKASVVSPVWNDMEPYM